MSRFEHEIDVNVPLGVAYDQWTQFEMFPLFMEGVKSSTRSTTRPWSGRPRSPARNGHGAPRSPTRHRTSRVAWKSIDGTPTPEPCCSRRSARTQTRVTLRIDADPDGLVENVGDKLGFLERRVKGDLERFKRLIESRGSPTGAWRGEIHGDEVRDDRSDKDRPTEAMSGLAAALGGIPLGEIRSALTCRCNARGADLVEVTT